MKQLDTEFLLQEWGVWLRVQSGVPHYVSPSYALMRDNVEMLGGQSDPQITDELALMVDRLVCRLYTRYPQAGTALWNYYRYQGLSYRQLGRLMELPLPRVQELLKVAIAWIDASLCAQLEAA